MTTRTEPPVGASDASTPEVQAALRDLARRLVWWLEPDAALADRRRFLAQAMTDANLDEMRLIRDVYGDDALRAVLADAPPGVFDRRSWDYWHVKLGFDHVPPMPVRRL
jgi:hypothetical protein